MFELLSFLSVIFTIITLFKVTSIQSDLDKTNSMLSKLRAGTAVVKPTLENAISNSSHSNGDTEVASTTINSGSVPKIVSTSSETVYINKLSELKSETHHSSQENVVHINTSTKNSFDIVDWFKEGFLIKLGSLFLILGFGWFMTLAISNNWISPLFQILLAIVIGSAITIGGIFMSSRNSQAASNQIFIFTGTVVNILAFFIARNVYGLIDINVAIGAMILNILLVGTLAVSKNYKVLAHVFQLALFAVPFLAGGAEDGRLFLTVYGILIAGLSLGVNFWKHWRFFNTTGFLLSFMFAVIGVIAGFNIWVFIYIAIYFFSNFIPVNKSAEVTGLDLFNVGLSTVLSMVLLLITNFETPVKTLIIIGFGLITSLLTGFFAKKEIFHKFGFVNMMASLFSFGIASLLFFGLSSIINLWIVAALILAGIYGCTFMARLYETPRLISFLNLILIPLGIAYFANDSFDFIGQSAYTYSQPLSILFASYTAISLLNARVFQISKIKDDKFSGFFYSIAGLSAMVFVWYFANLILGGFGVAAALFIYSFVGIAFLYNSYFAQQQFFKIASYMLLGFTIVRLFLVDLWLMELPVRIVTIMVIGVMFLATAFIKKKV
jgi:Predicted membrane protein (DUF2339)